MDDLLSNTHSHDHDHPMDESHTWMVTLAEPSVKSIDDWAELKCRHIGKDGCWATVLIHEQLPQFDGWSVRFDDQSQQALSLWRRYAFSNFEGVKLALNEVVRLADQHDHHPDVQFSYGFIEVSWNTHSAGGLSNNDWICAAHLHKALKHLG